MQEPIKWVVPHILNLAGGLKVKTVLVFRWTDMLITIYAPPRPEGTGYVEEELLIYSSWFIRLKISFSITYSFTVSDVKEMH